MERANSGFNILELVAVILIVSIIVTAATTSYREYVIRTKMVGVLPLVAEIKDLAAAYHARTGNFPSATDLGIFCKYGNIGDCTAPNDVCNISCRIENVTRIAIGRIDSQDKLFVEFDSAALAHRFDNASFTFRLDWIFDNDSVTGASYTCFTNTGFIDYVPSDCRNCFVGPDADNFCTPS